MPTQTGALTAEAATEPFLRAIEVIDRSEPAGLEVARSLAAARGDPAAVSRAGFDWV